jgi:hypothetical protein
VRNINNETNQNKPRTSSVMIGFDSIEVEIVFVDGKILKHSIGDDNDDDEDN